MCTRGDIQGIFLEIETRNWLGTVALNHVIQTTQGLPISVIDQQMNMEHQKYGKSFPPEKTWVFYVHVSWPRGTSGLHWASLPLVQWWFTGFLIDPMDHHNSHVIWSTFWWYSGVLKTTFSSSFFLTPIAGEVRMFFGFHVDVVEPGAHVTGLNMITRSWRWQESCWNLQCGEEQYGTIADS